MVLVGKVNKDIVLRLNRHGQSAIGLSGDDGGLLRVSRRAAPDGDGPRLRRAHRARRRRVIDHVASDYIPVIASVGADREGNSYNVNADEAAAAVARAIGAYKLMFLTDVVGWLRDPADPSSLISEASTDEVEAALGRRRRAACARSSRPASRRSTAASRARRSSTAGCRTRCCWSSSPTRASARRSSRPHDAGRRRAPGARARAPRARLRAPARGLRPRRGDAAVGRRGRRAPRLPDRAGRDRGRARPPGGRGRDPGAGRAPDPRRQPLLHRARWCAWPRA